MPWEDCYFAHTDDNRFTNTNCNRWFGIKDDTERDFSSKGMAVGAVRREIGGAGLGFGKRPYIHTDYHGMLKSTTDKEAFDRMAAGGYFPGRSLLERPYASRDYQEMKYQKPVAPLLAKTPPELKIERPEFEAPKAPEFPAFPEISKPIIIQGYICITDVSRVKVCLEDDSSADGIEFFDGNSARFTKEGLVDSDQILLYIYNIVQIKQTSPYIHIFFFVNGSWRKATSTEGGLLSEKIEVIPGKRFQGNPASCWLVRLNTTYWKGNAIENPTWDGTKWCDSGYAQPRVRLEPADGATWHQGFRPTKMRVTCSATGSSLWSLKDTNNSYICTASKNSGDIIMLDGSDGGNGWQGADIAEFLVYEVDPDPLCVTNIEFSNDG